MTIIVSYLSVKDSAATPAAGFYAQYSTDAGNNTGWVIFSGSYLQTLTPELYANANAFYGAGIAYRVKPELLVNGNLFYAVDVSYRLNADLLVNENIFYAANVSREYNPPVGRNYSVYYPQKNYTARQ